MSESADDLPEIDPTGPQLVYVVVADHLTAQIAAGRLGEGARLGSERDLAELYGVARMTIARAVRELRDRELVVTVIGKGTFVAPGAARRAARLQGE